MQEPYWRERWETGRTGFHEPEPNAELRAHVARLRDGASTAEPRVLVPLCGKSTDLAFLVGSGFAVTGVEFVEQAAEAFFQERALTPTREPWHGFAALSANSVRIAVGDFFTLSLPPNERFDAAYDRAALIAVRPDERERYVSTCLEALRPGARILLVSLYLDGGAPTGPPFSISEDEIRALFHRESVERIDEKDITASEAHLRERGAAKVLEEVWLVSKRA